MRFIYSIRKKILQIIGTFLLCLDIGGLDILYSVIFRAMENHWNNMEL